MTTSNSANTKQSNNASQKRKPIHNGYFNHPTFFQQYTHEYFDTGTRTEIYGSCHDARRSSCTA